MQADVKLDTLGYFCPMPIIMTSKKDMPAWCDTTGHQMVGLEEEQAQSGLIYKAYVKKTK